MPADERFKLLPVTRRASIKDFVNRNGISFAPGRGKSFTACTICCPTHCQPLMALGMAIASIGP